MHAPMRLLPGILFATVSLAGCQFLNGDGPAAPEFGGKIDRSYEKSVEWWPEPTRPPEDAPNVIIFLLDDTGFAQLGAFGGLIETPNIDRLAAGGLRYNRFHTTAICAPTRASMLTGRNHHTVHMGRITEAANGFPAYDSIIPREAATVAEVLRQNGYTTGMFGKGHLTPSWETGPAGPFDRWPTGLGATYKARPSRCCSEQARSRAWPSVG